MLAVDETSSRRGHNYLTFAADAEAHKVVFVTEGRDANTIAELGQFLSGRKATPEQITSVSIDMSPAFIKGVKQHPPNARITFDKFHVIAHASTAVDKITRYAAPIFICRPACLPMIERSAPFSWKS